MPKGRGCEDTQEEDGYWTGVMHEQAKGCQGLPQTPETRSGKEGFSPRAIRGSMAPLTPCSGTSSLQTEIINFCCFKPFSFQYFVTETLAN